MPEAVQQFDAACLHSKLALQLLRLRLALCQPLLQLLDLLLSLKQITLHH